jgi:hypothetical protein
VTGCRRLVLLPKLLELRQLAGCGQQITRRLERCGGVVERDYVVAVAHDDQPLGDGAVAGLGSDDGYLGADVAALGAADEMGAGLAGEAVNLPVVDLGGGGGQWAPGLRRLA